jgi:hypothetical protein
MGEISQLIRRHLNHPPGGVSRPAFGHHNAGHDRLRGSSRLPYPSWASNFATVESLLLSAALLVILAILALS